MVYIEVVEDENGDILEYKTYCSFCAPNLHNAWPCWPDYADCVECGVHLRDGEE